MLGKRYMTLYGLSPLTSGYSTDYDQDVDPRVTNEFATAGFRCFLFFVVLLIEYSVNIRFGHSLVPGIINVYNQASSQPVLSHY